MTVYSIFVRMDISLDYELLDFGGGRKLERFGSQILDRPEISAWQKTSKPFSYWKELTNARYVEVNEKVGQWELFKKSDLAWSISLQLPNNKLELGLHYGLHKHVGIFPEQIKHWDYFTRQLKPGKRMLNLFAYTGVASIVAASLGVEVFHVDSSKSIVKQAKQNAEKNQIATIHWVIEDALKFVLREAKRGHAYDYILMDPPAYGRGANGEIWKLDTLLPDLLSTAHSVLVPNGLLILNTYSPKMSLENQGQIAEQAGFKVFSEGKLKLTSRNQGSLEMSKFLYAASNKAT